MGSQQVNITEVRAPGGVGQIAEHGNGARQEVDPQVSRHAKDRRLGGAQLDRFADQVAPKRRRDRIAEARNQAEQGVEPHAEIGSRHRHGRIQQPGKAAESIKSREMGRIKLLIHPIRSSYPA